MDLQFNSITLLATPLTGIRVHTPNTIKQVRHIYTGWTEELAGLELPAARHRYRDGSSFPLGENEETMSKRAAMSHEPLPSVDEGRAKRDLPIRPVMFWLSYDVANTQVRSQVSRFKTFPYFSPPH